MHEETGHENRNDQFARRNVSTATSTFQPLHEFKGVESVRKIETGLGRGRWLSRKLRNTVLMHSRRGGDPPRTSSSLTRCAEYFRPLHKFIGVKSVRKIKTGLERDRWLSRKLRNTGGVIHPGNHLASLHLYPSANTHVSQLLGTRLGLLASICRVILHFGQLR